jgi:gas vesicle protein
MSDGDRSQGRNVAGAASEQGKETAERAASEASQVADTAKDQARQVKDEVATQARGLVDQAKNELRDQGRSQADQVAQAIRRVSDQADALAAGRIDEAGNVAEYVRRAGGQVRQVADRLDQRGVDGVVDDVQNFARRRPGAFLLGCAAAGFVTGRLLRGGAASSGNGGSDGDGFRSPQQTSTYTPRMA